MGAYLSVHAARWGEWGLLGAMAMNTSKILEVPPPSLALNEVHT